MGILQSNVFSYFYLNDVKVTVNPNSQGIDAVVYINVDVFGSIRSRLDTVVYNKETVKVQTVLEVMAVDFRDQSLIMAPQVGAYEAQYDEKYVVWMGPLNKQKNRISHHQMENGQLISFADISEQKLKREQQLSGFEADVHEQQQTLDDLHKTNENLERLNQQQQEIDRLKQSIEHYEAQQAKLQGA